MAKTHFLDWIVSPSESDTEGDAVTACGREWAENSTNRVSQVTCKQCQKAMQKGAQGNG